MQVNIQVRRILWEINGWNAKMEWMDEDDFPILYHSMILLRVTDTPPGGPLPTINHETNPNKALEHAYPPWNQKNN